MIPTAGPVPDGATWASPDPREAFTVSPEGRIAPLLPSVPSVDQQLRSELAAAQRQIRLLTIELDTISNAYHAFSNYADEARIRERLESKEMQVTRLELDLAKAQSESETLSAAYLDLTAPPSLADRFRKAWAELTTSPRLPPPTP